MIEIIPAIIPTSREDIEQAVERYVDSPIQTLQIDLVDGSFAKPKSWPYSSREQYDEFKLLEKNGFPGWQDIDIELDLMIENPLKDMEHFIEWGPSRIIVHAGSVDPEAYRDFLEQHNSVRSFIEFGIAFGTEDVVADYKSIIEIIDFVQCMGVNPVGKQKQPFDERVFLQIQTVKEIAPDITISVDGAVTPLVSAQLIEAGVSRLVSGSFLAKSLNIAESLTELHGDFFNEEL